MSMELIIDVITSGIRANFLFIVSKIPFVRSQRSKLGYKRTIYVPFCIH